MKQSLYIILYCLGEYIIFTWYCSMGTCRLRAYIYNHVFNSHHNVMEDDVESRVHCARWVVKQYIESEEWNECRKRLYQQRKSLSYKLHPVFMCLYVYDVQTCIETYVAPSDADVVFLCRSPCLRVWPRRCWQSVWDPCSLQVTPSRTRRWDDIIGSGKWPSTIAGLDW